MGRSFLLTDITNGSQLFGRWGGGGGGGMVDRSVSVLTDITEWFAMGFLLPRGRPAVFY